MSRLPARRAGQSLIVLAIVGLLVTALLVHHSSGGSSSAQRAAPVAAAQAALTTSLGYDYRHLDAGLAAAKATMTPAFASTYARTFAATASKLAVANKGVVRVTVQKAGLVNLGSGRATVLAFVDQVRGAASSTPKAGKVVTSRVIVHLVDTDGHWLVDAIAPF